MAGEALVGDGMDLDRRQASAQLAELDRLVRRPPARPSSVSPVLVAVGLSLWLAALMGVSALGLNPMIAAVVRIVLGFLPALFVASAQERRGVIASLPSYRPQFYLGCVVVALAAVAASVVLALGSPWWIAAPGHIVLMLLGLAWVWMLVDVESTHRQKQGLGFRHVPPPVELIEHVSVRVAIVLVLLTCRRMELSLLSDAVDADGDTVAAHLLSLESDGLVRRSSPWVDVSGTWFEATATGQRACRAYRSELVQAVRSGDIGFVTA